MDDRYRFYCTVTPAPPGFEAVRLTKRHLLHGTVVVLVEAPSEIEALLPDYRERMRGVIIVRGTPAGAHPLGPLLWLLTLEHGQAQLRDERLAGWLEAIRRACVHEEAQRAALLDNDRLRFELGRLRDDYNRVTSKLQKQLDQLTEAKSLLESWNVQLETKVRERTAELEHAQAQLVRSEKLASLGSLMAGFAHELNTPLGNALLSATTLDDEARRIAAATSAQRLRRADLDAFLHLCRDSVDVMQRNLRRASSLIQHFRQMEVGDADLEPLQAFRLLDLVQDSVTSFGPSLRGTAHRVDVDVPPELALQSYPGALGQVLANLMTNALRHAFEGRDAGVIRIAAREEPRGTVVLRFEDDGIGIPTGQLDKIFDPFYTTRLGQGGSGIGLYLVYKLVYRVLGGGVDVRSELGRGTSFVLTLPVVAKALAAT